MDSINKAFEILEIFFKTDEELSISDIARITGLSSSTSHRITSILVKRGYIDQSHKRAKYKLSSKKLVDFARLIRHRLKLRNIALPFMKELTDNVDEAVELSLRHGNIAYNVEVVNSDRLLNITPDSSTFNLYSTAVGKVFLAYYSQKELREYFNEIKLIPRTPNTITDPDELRRQLNKIKQDGVAFDDEEHELGVRSVAAPIKDWDENVIAALGVVGPSIRISRQRMVELAPFVASCAFQISHAMGNASVKENFDKSFNENDKNDVLKGQFREN